MNYHHVEVDDEVFRYVQDKAEPLVDDFNSAIKRLLGLSVGGTAVVITEKLGDAHHDVPELNQWGLSVRIMNVLSNHSINTVQILLRKSAEDLLRFRHLRKKDLSELKSKLDTYGLQLAENSTSIVVPTFSSGLPEALRQVLEVAQLVLHGHDRIEATQAVAREHTISQQSVLDKYCRQLGYTAAQFDTQLEEPGRQELRERLKQRFPDYHEVIDEVLNN